MTSRIHQQQRIVLLVLLVILGALIGWLFTHRTPKPVAIISTPEAPVVPKKVKPKQVRPSKGGQRDQFKDGTTVEMMASSRDNETVLRFPSDETYESFLTVVQSSPVRVVDRLDRLRAIRLGFDDSEDLDALLAGENISVYSSVTRMPDRSAPGSGVQEGAVGFDEKVMAWLGVQGNHSNWGEGVKVALLDSGAVGHEALPGLVKSIAIEPFPADLLETNGHGTAVASLIAGNSRTAPGVAPAAQLISVRVCNETGVADSFSISAGLLAAMDEGAEIINISMGSYENSPLMEDAVWLVQQKGIVVVAASGNDGQNDAAYPAAYPGVISVGAVDARGEQLDFSNYGEYLSLTAPGYQVNAAWPGNRYMRMSGTSVSAPLVSGAIAATMSHGDGVRMSASEAAALVMQYTDEAGIPGPDSQYGSGILDLGRVIFRQTPGILDVAITNQRIVSTSGDGQELRVTVQNRGTAILINTLLEIETAAGTKKMNATTIAPGAIQTFAMPLPGSLKKNMPFQVTSRVYLGTPGQDPTPQNNVRTSSFSVR